MLYVLYVLLFLFLAIVKVKVIEGKDLPIMDRASDLTDAFVEVCILTE